MPKQIAIATLVGTLLVGCQTTEDPAKAGFFSGVGNLATGRYDQRLEQKQQDLQASQTQRDYWQARAASLQSDANRSEDEKRAWQRRLDALDEELSAMDTKIARLKRERRSNQQRVQELDRQIVDIRRDRSLLASAARDQQDPAAMQATEARSRQVLLQLDALIAVPLRRE